MAERVPPFYPLPNDKMFSPRGVNEEEVRGKDKKAADALLLDEEWMSMANRDKIAAWEAQAQDMANQLNVAILLHYSELPRFQWTGPTMRADFIPGNEVPPYVPPAAPGSDAR